jgi:hypothetical protein
MESARWVRVAVIVTMHTNQRFARNLQVQPRLKKSITTLTDIDSVQGCYWLQNSPKARNTEESRLRLLVRGVGCKVPGVQLSDSQKPNLYHSLIENVT